MYVVDYERIHLAARSGLACQGLVTHYLFYNTGYDPLIPWPAVQGEQLSIH